MSSMPDSYSAMIRCEFPTFFACTCAVWNLVRGVKCMQRRVSRVTILFVAVQAPASLPLPKPSPIAFVVQIGKKPIASLHLFSRPERLNWKATKIVTWEITMIFFLL